MKAVIVCGGNPPSKVLLEQEIGEDTIIICADSGADILYEYKVTPHYLIGDFDSIKPKVLEFFKSSNIQIDKYPVEKDNTDSELALKKALELGVKEVVLLGCTGSRIDHIFGNLGLLRLCVEHKVKGTIKDEFNTIFLIDRSSKLKGRSGETFSLQSFSGLVRNLNIKGAKYPLNNYDLQLGSPITISNMFLKEDVHIEFEEGLLLVFYSRD